MAAKQYTLVTGGAGFIGSHLSKNLLKSGHNVLILDDFNDYYDPKLKQKNILDLNKDKNFLVVRGDITDANKMSELFKKYSFNLIYHLAARAGVRPSIKNPELYERVNILGSLNILNAAKNFGVKKIIMASSSSVYGNNTKVPFAESDNVDNPISPYAATKKATELLAYTYHHLYKLQIACLRFFTVYGPRQRPDMAINNFIRTIAADQPINMYGNGDTRRDYTFIEDIISGLLKVAQHDFDYEIFNLGNSETVELKKLIDLIAAGLQKKAKINKLPEQPGDVAITYADISKARRLLGYAPQTSIETGIQQTLQWFKGEIPW